MTIVKPSSKYQIVIPREVRDQLQLKQGQALYLEVISPTELRLSTESALERARRMFVGKKVWGDDPIKTLRHERLAWDERSAKTYESLS